MQLHFISLAVMASVLFRRTTDQFRTAPSQCAVRRSRIIRNGARSHRALGIVRYHRAAYLKVAARAFSDMRLTLLGWDGRLI